VCHHDDNCFLKDLESDILPQQRRAANLVEESDDLATSLLALCFIMVHDAESGGDHDLAELPSGEEVGTPPLILVDTNVKARGDHTALVEPAPKVNNDLGTSVVIKDLELANVSCESIK
jgi:hypothetical protein